MHHHTFTPTESTRFAHVTHEARCATCGASVQHVNGVAPSCEEDEEARELAARLPRGDRPMFP